MNKLSIAALAAVTLAVSTNANAAEPATAGKPNVGAALLYGIYTGDDDADTGLNPYGVGFGINGGYTLDMGLHVGAGFNYFLGDSVGDVDLNMYQFMGIVGYDLGLTPELVLRPQLGIGMNWSSVSSPLGDETESDLAITPGAKVLYDLGGFYVSGEAAYHHVFADDVNVDGFLLGAGAGLTF